MVPGVWLLSVFGRGSGQVSSGDCVFAAGGCRPGKTNRRPCAALDLGVAHWLDGGGRPLLRRRTTAAGPFVFAGLVDHPASRTGPANNIPGPVLRPPSTGAP